MKIGAEYKSNDVPLAKVVHDSPPLTDFKMVPPRPEMYPVLLSTKQIDSNLCNVLLGIIDHVEPPSMVLKIVPLFPIMYPLLALKKLTAQSEFPCGNGFCHCQPCACKLFNDNSAITKM